jgi:hypothetical protein
MSEVMLADSKLARLVATMARKTEARPQPEAGLATVVTQPTPAGGPAAA